MFIKVIAASILFLGMSTSGNAAQPTSVPFHAYSFSSLRNGTGPSLGTRERKQITAVYQASPVALRDRLVYVRVNGRLIMFYASLRDLRKGDDPTVYHVLGDCNEYFRRGEWFAGTGIECMHWKPSAADIAARKYR